MQSSSLNISALREFVPTHELPDHLRDWTLPPGWRWGKDGVFDTHRHYQEIIDNMSRSLSLVTAPNSLHADWLLAEAKFLAQRNHPSIPTTYLAWQKEPKRGPGYLRRWILGETVLDRAQKSTPDVPQAVRTMRLAASCLSYLHDSGLSHGAVGPEALWLIPSGRLWLISWQWAVKEHAPEDAFPKNSSCPWAPEWLASPNSDAREKSLWKPTPLSDQWQLAATIVELISHKPYTGELSLSELCPDAPKSFQKILEKALDPDPSKRFSSLLALLREAERQVGSAKTLITSSGISQPADVDQTEASLRYATADDYEVIAPLGKGAFGSVWRVRDLALGRSVALKVLHPHIAADRKIVSTFRKEAQLAASLSHPAIVPIFDWDTRQGTSWYTMELAENGSLANLVENQGPRRYDETCEQAGFVLDALCAAHTAGVIHRDIKPENILIDRWGAWRIGDFGVAQYIKNDKSQGGPMTPAFAAPEQFLGEEITPATDVFSFAAVIYYVLTGTPPFGTDKPLAIVRRQLQSDFQNIDAVPKNVLPWLKKALSPDVSARYQTASAARDAWLALPPTPSTILTWLTTPLVRSPAPRPVLSGRNALRQPT